MNLIVLPLFLLCFSNLQTAVLSSPWFRKGLGRVIWALVPNSSHPQSDVLVLTARSTIASLSINDGSILWRIPYPISDNNVHPTAVVSNGEVVVAQFSDKRLRSCHRNGSVLWEISSCELQGLKGTEALYRSCDSGRNMHIDLVDGISGSHEQRNEELPISAENFESNQVGRRTWQVHNTILSSGDDGRFEALRNDEVLWYLEEGISHPLDVVLFPFENFPVVVLLSELGFVAGLGGTADLKMLWKAPVMGKCRLVHGHAEFVVIVCLHGKESRVLVLNPISGEEISRNRFEDFIVRSAAIHETCKAHVCVHLSDANGRNEIVPAPSTISGDEHLIRIQCEAGGSELTAFVAESTVWKINVAQGSNIVAVISDERHPLESTLSPPAVRVTGDRRVLFKYTYPHVFVVLSFDEAKECVYAMLVDGRTGETFEVVEHPNSRPTVLGTKGENWFLYTTWNTELLVNEVHIVDMYEQQKRHVSWVRKRLQQSLSRYWASFSYLPVVQPSVRRSEAIPTNSSCARDDKPPKLGAEDHPHVVRSSMVLTHIPAEMAVTRTRLGITEQSVVFVLASGQSILVPKSTIDARRPRRMNPAYASEYLRKYSPSLSLQSSSNVYEGDNRIQPVGIQTVLCAPDMSRESSSHIVLTGLDLLFTRVYPIGKFDFLDSDFNFLTVLLVISVLLFSYLYSENLLQKTSLSRSW